MWEPHYLVAAEGENDVPTQDRMQNIIRTICDL